MPRKVRHLEVPELHQEVVDDDMLSGGECCGVYLYNVFVGMDDSWLFVMTPPVAAAAAVAWLLNYLDLHPPQPNY